MTDSGVISKLTAETIGYGQNSDDTIR